MAGIDVGSGKSEAVERGVMLMVDVEHFPAAFLGDWASGVVFHAIAMGEAAAKPAWKHMLLEPSSGGPAVPNGTKDCR